MKVEFLTVEDVVAIHRDQIERYSGSVGVRDLGLLESAVAMARAGAGEQTFHEDLFEMAAAYLFHIVCNHPFVDGNKRVGAMSALVFLVLNGVALTAREDAFEELVRAVARGEAEKSAVADFLRANSAERSA